MTDKFHFVIDEVISHLQALRAQLSESELEAFIEEVRNAKKVFVCGAGRSGYVARCFAQRLMQIGYEAFFVGDTTTPAAARGDLLVAVTGSGETPSVITMLRLAKDIGMRSAVITTRERSSAASLANLKLKVPGKTKMLEKVTHAPFTSLFDIATLTVLDGVTAELMARKGVTDQDIQRTHANLE